MLVVYFYYIVQTYADGVGLSDGQLFHQLFRAEFGVQQLFALDTVINACAAHFHVRAFSRRSGVIGRNKSRFKKVVDCFRAFL